MATEIRSTPILTGKDAENFINNMIKSEQRKVSKQDLKEINDSGRLKRILFKSKI